MTRRRSLVIGLPTLLSHHFPTWFFVLAHPDIPGRIKRKTLKTRTRRLELSLIYISFVSRDMDRIL